MSKIGLAHDMFLSVYMGTLSYNSIEKKKCSFYSKFYISTLLGKSNLSHTYSTTQSLTNRLWHVCHNEHILFCIEIYKNLYSYKNIISMWHHWQRNFKYRLEFSCSKKDLTTNDKITCPFLKKVTTIMCKIHFF